jgi:hypothetical protein
MSHSQNQTHSTSLQVHHSFSPSSLGFSLGTDFTCLGSLLVDSVVGRCALVLINFFTTGFLYMFFLFCLCQTHFVVVDDAATVDLTMVFDILSSSHTTMVRLSSCMWRMRCPFFPPRWTGNINIFNTTISTDEQYFHVEHGPYQNHRGYFWFESIYAALFKIFCLYAC